MSSEPENKIEPKEQENAEMQEIETASLLVGAALNLGRAARVVTNCFQAIGANVKRWGGDMIVKEPIAAPDTGSETALTQKDEPEKETGSGDEAKKGEEPEKEKKRKN